MRSKAKKAAKPNESIELIPDAWPRFERFIKQVVKAGPQHRKAKPAKAKNRKTRSENGRRK